MSLAVRLAILVDSVRCLAPGGAIGGPVLGALIECLTLVPGTKVEKHNAMFMWRFSLEWELAGVPLDRLARVGGRSPHNLIQVDA